MSVRIERLRQDQTVINLGRLNELYQKEANHDEYLRASLAMGVKQRKRQELAKQARTKGDTAEAAYHLGWLDGLSEYNNIILDNVARQLEAHPHMDLPLPRAIRKGQRCLLNEPGCSCLVAIR